MTVFFSSKISNSILTYFEREGLSQEFVYNQTHWPVEFLKDPSCWLEADTLEDFLKHAEKEAGDIEKIGLMTPKLHAWGPLDSVLRLMGRPQDILSQPDRFLSYFISPPPPIDLIDRAEESITFRLPISSEEYPMTTRFLKGAFEALPVYAGKPHAASSWKDNTIVITWSTQQENLIADSESQNVNPNLITSLMSALENSQKELGEKQKELLLKTQEIEKLKKQYLGIVCVGEQTENLQDLANLSELMTRELDHSLAQVVHQVARLQDYLVRSQQLVTVFSSQVSTPARVQQALKKVDWENVTKQTPHVVREATERIQKIQRMASEFLSAVRTSKDKKEFSSKTHSTEDNLQFPLQ
ncbi:MAG: hypothetical protein AB7F59_13830 [Bdellovibrionales bacterium]